MAPVLTSRRLPTLVAIGAVLVAFWPALFGGGSLVADDLVATAPPFDAHRSDTWTLEGGPGDTINIHAHWASLAADVRAGDVGWWNDELAAGQPTFKGGLPVFDLPYLAVPAWYGPGLVAAIRALTAIALTAGFLRAVGIGRLGMLAGGLAYGFSGFMVGWMNWPHSSVAALVPGLLWGVERLLRDPAWWRAVPLGGVVALMVWSNFPSATAYALLGVAAYTAVRLVAEQRARALRPARVAGVAMLGVLIAVLLSVPHLVGFADYLDWADTTHREDDPSDSSAGVAYLLTAVAPSVWGSDNVGPAWFGEGNWTEFHTHAGSAVVVLAAIGFVAAARDGDRRRRSVAMGLALVLVIGVMIAYVGGPVGVALSEVTGARGGLMTRAKLLVSLGLAAGAALGVDRLASAERGDRLRREVTVAAGLLAVVALALLPSVRDWWDAARGLGVWKEVVAVSTTSVLASVATVAIVGARLRGAITGAAAGWALVAVVAVEVLSYAMPVPTIVGRSERLRATPAHEAVAAELAPGERLAGEGRTFFPSTTQLFDIPDARGQLLKPPGYQALILEADPDALSLAGGGTPTYPDLGPATDADSPIWDALAVGVWAQFPDSFPPGRRLDPSGATDRADANVVTVVGSTQVPEGGLRAVILDVEVPAAGWLDVAVTTVDGTATTRRRLEPADTGVVPVPVLGEHLPVGSPVVVEVSAPDEAMRVAVDDLGATLGTVAGDDDLELFRTGDVMLLHRPVEPVRLSATAVVEPDPTEAARLVARRTADDAGVVIDAELGLPATPGAASPRVLDATIESGRVLATVETDVAAVLVVAQARYPGWTATVDGVPARIVTADSMFLGVELPAGAREVELSFRPRHLGWSMASLVAGLVVVAILMVAAWRRRRLPSPPTAAR